MGNSKKKTNEIIEKIEAEKEILATMPKNNKKNIAKYLEKIEQLKKEYTNLLDKSVREMKKRYDNTIDIKSNEEIEKNNAELERISKILKLLSLLITLQQRKEKQIKLLKQAMFQTLFTNKNVPQLRFKGFTDNWEQRKLGDLTQRIKSYPISHDAETKYIHYGDIHTGKLKRITNEKILPNINDNNYIPLKSGDVIVADASEDYKGIADACVIDLMKEHYKIVSGLHTIVFRPNEKLKSDFLYTYLHTSIFKHYGYRVGTGLKVFGISYNNLSNMKIKLPKIDEQNKVDKIINIVTNLVTLQQNKTKKLENLKQFLLQNMFI